MGDRDKPLIDADCVTPIRADKHARASIKRLVLVPGEDRWKPLEQADFDAQVFLRILAKIVEHLDGFGGQLVDVVV